MTRLRWLLTVLTLLWVFHGGEALAAASCDINMFANSTTPATCPAPTETFSITVNRSCGESSAAAPNPIRTHRLFSSVTCRVQKVVESTLGQIWCVVQNELRTPLAALITLYLSTIGAMIVIGMMQFSTRDIMVQFLKIILIWLFATQGDYAIRMGYHFFSTVMSEGIVMVTSAGTSAGGVGGVIERFDTIVSELLLINAGSKVMTVGAGIAALHASTPIGGSIGLFLIMTVAYSLMTLLRCVVFYLVSIAAVAFLWAFSPIFLCTALFRTSGHIFTNWLAFVIAFTLQPILLFGFLAFMEKHIVESIDVFSCLVQERTAIVRTVPEYDSTFALLSEQPYRLTRKSYCATGYYCVCIDPTATDCKCERTLDDGVSVERTNACEIITTEAGWNEATDFMNTIGGQILAALVIMIMTNALLMRLPRFAAVLSGTGISLAMNMPIFSTLDRDSSGIMGQVNAWAGWRKGADGKYETAFINSDGTINRTTVVNPDGTVSRRSLRDTIVGTAQEELKEM